MLTGMIDCIYGVLVIDGYLCYQVYGTYMYIAESRDDVAKKRQRQGE